jgi:hypothetical protein
LTLSAFDGFGKEPAVREIEEARKNNPNMSEQEIRQNYDTYFLSVNIHAKFLDSKLVYLAVSKSETT